MSRITPIPSTMLQSSIWRQDSDVCKVWMTMLMLKDEKGKVEASVGGLADEAKVTVENVQRALQGFLSPDPDSKTKTDEGRRIRTVDGGWLIINHEKYAMLKDEDGPRIRSQIKARERAKRYRKKKGSATATAVTPVTPRHALCVTNVTHKPAHTEETAQGNLFSSEPVEPSAPPENKTERARQKRLPTTEPAKRIAALFHRRLTTTWSLGEIAAFKAIGPIDSADLDLIEAYYVRERAKGDGEKGGIHRRDLGTFLNNYTGELDRARASAPLSAAKAQKQEDPAGWREFLASISRPYEQFRFAPGFLKTDFGKSKFSRPKNHE